MMDDKGISSLKKLKHLDFHRIYSQVYHAHGNYSLREGADFLPIRESQDIQDFLEEFYSGIDVTPNDVEYVEACGSGIAKADGNELEAIGKVFGKEKPIKVGCVKSNMGHSEPASGVCSLTKTCLAYHKGQLPANLHYYEPQTHLTSLQENKVEVLQKKQPFNRGFTALNSFSYTGANIHVLLKGHYKPKDIEKFKSSIPRIVLISGRQESCVNNILNALKKQPVDPEQLGLLQSIHENEIPGHMCRGYTILDTNAKKETVCLSQKVDYFSATSRPIWFVYSGMGSQWAGMGSELMKIPTFAAAIYRCHKALEPKGINLVEVLTEPDKTIYDNILNSFVGIAAVQIGLTDVLRELGIVPDNIIGHSVGELGCAYADGCFTAEEMILSAYSRGLVSIQTPFIRGSMAAVGLGYKTVLPLLPPEIEVACHNSSESSTISGPSDVMKKFVGELTARGTFAKEVPCSNIAYHSRYISAAGPGLLKYLSEVIKNPKERSEKWVSTSVPQNQWNDPKAKYSSALYHTNNLLNSVLFEETAKLIPAQALLIEIAPHGLLQAILKRSHSECVHMPLTRRGHSNPVLFFLEAVGKLYQEGLNPKLENLYPKIEFPVSTETPLLSHLVEWEHSESWPEAKYNSKDRVMATARKVVLSVHDDDYKYLDGCVRDDLLVFSEAAMLVLVWETLAMQRGANYRDLSVVFKNVHFHGEANIKPEVSLRLGIMVHKGDNKFEVSHDGTAIITGFIYTIKSNIAGFHTIEQTKQDSDDETILTADDVYKIMRHKGFSYKNEFRTIQSTTIDRSKANVKWNDEWAIFLDSLIQLNTFARDHDGISIPKSIRKLTINRDSQSKVQAVVENGITCYTAELYKIFGITRCAGVEIDNITFHDKPVVKKDPDMLMNRSFIPHFLTREMTIKDALFVNLQIVTDNISKNILSITEISTKSTSSFFNVIKEVFRELPNVNFEVKSFQRDASFEDVEKFCKTDVFVIENLLGDEKKMKNLSKVLSKNAFVLTYEENTTVVQKKYEYYNVVTAINVQKKMCVLLNNENVAQNENVIFISVNPDDKFNWVPRVQSELKKTKRVVLVSEKKISCGVLGLFKELVKDYPNKIGVVVIDDYLVPYFNPEYKTFKEQLEKNLTINVLKKGQWGGYYYLPRPKYCDTWNVKLTSSIPGDFDSLTWTEVPITPASNTKVQVCCAGPSFRDAQKAVGKVKLKDISFGMDFSGIDNKGERVIGLVAGGSIASTVQADPDLIWPVPEHWSLEEAATVPLPYIHAYYCLTMNYGYHNSSKNVFVNSGAGAFGQAVISICLALSFNVFTTVSTVQKKRFLLRLFPQLQAENISCSRDDSFSDSVTKASNGAKCSYVINSLSGPLRLAAMKCVGRKGLFLDISDSDMFENQNFGMFFLKEERNYKAVNVANIFKPESFKERKMLQLLVADGIATGVVKPISRIVYSPNDVSRAFRLLSSGKSIGRVLIKMREPNTLIQGINVKPNISFSPEETNIIIGHGNGLGIELADHLVKNGAKKLLFHLKQSTVSGYFWTKVAHFVIIAHSPQSAVDAFSVSSVEKICGARSEIGLPALVLHTGVLKEFDENLDASDTKFKPQTVRTLFSALETSLKLKYNNVVTFEFKKGPETEYLDKIAQVLDASDTKFKPQTVRTLFSALETSLKLKYNNVVTFEFKKGPETEYLDKIAQVLGVNSINEAPQDVPLGNLNITDVSIEEIKVILKEAHQKNYPYDKLEKMSIYQIKCTGDEKYRRTNFESGLGAFYTFIDEDECMATEPLVTMPTKLSNATEQEEELDPKETYLILIPGFEGHHQIFTPICERLKLPAITYQLGPDVLDYNIPQMADNIMKYLKKRFELKSKFYLLGYSFGVNVVLELAALMEKEGHVGVVYCLDSSPDALRVYLDAYVGNFGDTELENSIIEHMYQLMTGNKSYELKEDLNKLETWKDKVEACVNRLRGTVHYSHQYKRSILESAYRRIKLAREYNPELQLNSQIVLLKGVAHPRAIKLPDDYNLSKYSKNSIKIFDLESDHATAPNDCRISNVINSLLEPKILEEFKKKNLCETYLADPFNIL